MHNGTDYRQLLLNAEDKKVLKWCAYAQLGAVLVLFLLVLVIAFSSDGVRIDKGNPAQANAATPAAVAKVDEDRRCAAGA